VGKSLDESLVEVPEMSVLVEGSWVKASRIFQRVSYSDFVGFDDKA
jgi:hypothetical protein